MSLEDKTPDEINALAQLADTVLNNPKTRTPYQRLLKQANPNISLPEIDNLDMVASAVKPHIDKIAQIEQERAAEKAQSEAQGAASAVYEALKDDGVIRTRAEFQALVKYANDKGFQTVETGLRMAASHRASESELAQPSPMPGTGPEFAPGNEAYKDFFKNPKGTATAIATQMVNEMKSGKIKLPAQMNQTH